MSEPYLGFGIDQRRCAACLAAPTLPCAVHRDHPACSGASDCPSALHEHGCFADLDGAACNDADDHAATPPTARVGNCIQVGHNYAPHPETDHCLVFVPLAQPASVESGDCDA